MQSQIDLETVISQNKKMPVADVDGELGFMNVEKGKYYMIDGVGIRIWNLITNPNSINRIVDDLLKEYDVKRDVCNRDVLEFVNDLNSQGLIIKLK